MRVVALLLGMALLAFGVAGFMPAFVENGLVFGLMPVNHVMSAIFVVTGLVGIGIGMKMRHGLAPPPPTPGGHDLRNWM